MTTGKGPALTMTPVCPGRCLPFPQHLPHAETPSGRCLGVPSSTFILDRRRWLGKPAGALSLHHRASVCEYMPPGAPQAGTLVTTT